MQRLSDCFVLLRSGDRNACYVKPSACIAAFEQRQQDRIDLFVSQT